MPYNYSFFLCKTVAAEAPRHFTLLHHILQHLPVFQRVHRAKETIVLICHELVRRSQTFERLDDKLFAFPHKFEYLCAGAGKNHH